LYVKYLSGSDSEASILEAQLLIDRLNELSEGEIEEKALSLLKSQVTLLKAQFLLMKNQADEASLVLDDLQNTFPDSQAAELSYIVLADFYTLSEEYDLAESYLLKLAKNYPESDYAPEALLEAALNAEKRESNAFGQSIQLLNQLTLTYSDSPLVFFAIRHQGDLLRKASDFSGALSVYDNLIQKFPDHSNRYLADLSRLDCLLALANQNTDYDFKEIILELERLLDLPDLPNEFQLEVRYKLAFILSQIEQFNVANKVILSIVNDYINSNSLEGSFSSIESYWIARSLFLLCDHLNADNQIEESKKIYRMIIAYNLPGYQLAKQLLLEL
jgi:tetratricopeptide (TPR) repeat protein